VASRANPHAPSCRTTCRRPTARRLIGGSVPDRRRPGGSPDGFRVDVDGTWGAAGHGSPRAVACASCNSSGSRSPISICPARPPPLASAAATRNRLFMTASIALILRPLRSTPRRCRQADCRRCGVIDSYACCGLPPAGPEHGRAASGIVLAVRVADGPGRARRQPSPTSPSPTHHELLGSSPAACWRGRLVRSPRQVSTAIRSASTLRACTRAAHLSLVLFAAARFLIGFKALPHLRRRFADVSHWSPSGRGGRLPPSPLRATTVACALWPPIVDPMSSELGWRDLPDGRCLLPGDR